MDFIKDIVLSQPFIMSLQIIVATSVGAMIGYDREKIGKPAGVKTHALVCLGSCLVMLVGSATAKQAGSDVNRLAAQVVSGMGFLCGGVIIVTAKNEIKGLTTAAGLWFAACMGLCIGSDYAWLVIPATLCYYFITHILSKLDRKLRNSQSSDDELEQDEEDKVVS